MRTKSESRNSPTIETFSLYLLYRFAHFIILWKKSNGAITSAIVRCRLYKFPDDAGRDFQFAVPVYLLSSFIAFRFRGLNYRAWQMKFSICSMCCESFSMSRIALQQAVIDGHVDNLSERHSIRLNCVVALVLLGLKNSSKSVMKGGTSFFKAMSLTLYFFSINSARWLYPVQYLSSIRLVSKLFLVESFGDTQKATNQCNRTLKPTFFAVCSPKSEDTATLQLESSEVNL